MVALNTLFIVCFLRFWSTSWHMFRFLLLGALFLVLFVGVLRCFWVVWEVFVCAVALLSLLFVSSLTRSLHRYRYYTSVVGCWNWYSMLLHQLGDIYQMLQCITWCDQCWYEMLINANHIFFKHTMMCFMLNTATYFIAGTAKYPIFDAVTMLLNGYNISMWLGNLSLTFIVDSC